MRILVFFLVLANILFFALTEGYFGRPDNPDAGRAEQQVNAERIKIVARGAPPALPAAPAADVEPAAKDKGPEAAREAPAEAAKEAVKEVPAASACLVWSGLAGKDADRLSALLAEKFDSYRQSRKLMGSEGAGWWVFIPPLPTKAEADKKAGELRQLGVGDYFVVQDAGPNRFAISLGVFSAEAGARDRLEELKKLGVKSARSGQRPGKDALYQLEAHGPAERQAALQAAVAKVLPALAAQHCR